MSDGFWENGTEEVEETNAMRVLREKAEADGKVIREMADKIAKMEARDSATRLDGLLKAKNLDPKVKDLIPKDADPEKFLADYGALLVTASTEGSEESGGETDEAEGEGSADEAAARAAIAGAASGAQPKAGLDVVTAKLQPGAFDNAEDLLAFLQSQ